MTPEELLEAVHTGTLLGMLGAMVTDPQERLTLAYILGQPGTVAVAYADDLAVRLRLCRVKRSGDE